MKPIILICINLFLLIMLNCEKNFDEITTTEHINQATIKGMVQDSLVKRGISKAEILLTPGNISTITDSLGEYGLSNINPGHYILKAMHSGYKSDSQLINLGENELVIKDLKLVNLDLFDFFMNLPYCDSPRNSPTPSLGSYINEPILMESSGYINNIYHNQNVALFDLNEKSIIHNYPTYDVMIEYWTPHASDEDMWVVDKFSQCISRIGYGPSQGATIPTLHRHLLSALELPVIDLIDNNKGIIFLGFGSVPQLKVIILNPDYFAISLTDIEINHGPVGGLTFDGEFFWLSIVPFGKFIKISKSGEFVQDYSLPVSAQSLAFDGEYIWGVSTWKIFKLNLSGQIICEFSVPHQIGIPPGLTWGDNKLWLQLREYYESKIYAINPDSSCSLGYTVITDILNIPGGYYNSVYRGLAWSDSSLFIATDKLYQVNTDGVIIRSFEIPLEGISDMTFENENLWINNYGPLNLSGGNVLTKFRIPN